MNEATTCRRAPLLATAITLPFLLAFSAYAWWGKIWTDEGWNFYAVHLNHLGLRPYVDYFTHRLSLWEDVHGLIYQFAPSFLALRFVTVAEAALGVWVLAYVILRITRQWQCAAIGLALLWNMECIQALSTVSVYALPGLAFALSCLCLLASRENMVFVSGLFLLLQGVLWAMRYPVDVQLVILVLSTAFCVWRCGASVRNVTWLAGCALAAPAWAIRSWLLSGDTAVWSDTVTFNFGQLDFMVSHALPENWRPRLMRTLYLRELELKAFLPVVAIGLGCLVLQSGRLLAWLRDWRRGGQDSVVLYAGLVFAGYYSFLLVSAFDFPVTKAYVIPALAILVAVSLKSLYSAIPGESRVAITTILLVILGSWPIIQEGRGLSRHFSAHQVLATYRAEILPELKPGARVFSFNLLLPTLGVEIDPVASMELFSFVHSWNDAEARRLHLMTPNRLRLNLERGTYDALILEEDRFFKDNGDMSRILNSHRAGLIEAIDKSYELRKRFHTPFRGDVFVYVKKCE